MHALPVIEHVIALKISFPQKFTYIMHYCSLNQTWVACEYIQSTHWLATGYLIGQAWKNQNLEKSSLETNMRTRTLPSQNACRVKADGMGSIYRQDFRCCVLFDVQPLRLCQCKT